MLTTRGATTRAKATKRAIAQLLKKKKKKKKVKKKKSFFCFTLRSGGEVSEGVVDSSQ
jgi:hypothetical protein